MKATKTASGKYYIYKELKGKSHKPKQFIFFLKKTLNTGNISVPKELQGKSARLLLEVVED